MPLVACEYETFKILVDEGLVLIPEEAEFLKFWYHKTRTKFSFSSGTYPLYYLKGVGIGCCDSVMRRKYLEFIKKVNNRFPCQWKNEVLEKIA